MFIAAVFTIADLWISQVHQQMNERKCGIYTLQRIIQSERRMKSCHLQENRYEYHVK
jgi:hypothetical protein